MHDFGDRIDEVTEQLIHAAENVVLFTSINDGLHKQIIEAMMAIP
jgi:hypothetical protein